MITKDGFDYGFIPTKCETCEGNCCIGESGYIWITFQEIQALSEYLNLSVEETIQKYIKKVGYRFSLIEKRIEADNFACIFFDLETKRCLIYDVRPTQCRTFPFWEYFKTHKKELYKECPAIDTL